MVGGDGKTWGRETMSRQITYMDDGGQFMAAIGRYMCGENVGCWILGGEIQRSSGDEVAR